MRKVRVRTVMKSRLRKKTETKKSSQFLTQSPKSKIWAEVRRPHREDPGLESTPMSGLCGCPAMIPPPPLDSPATPLREEEKAKAKIVRSTSTPAATLASTRSSDNTRSRRRPVRAEEIHGQFLVATRHLKDVRRDRSHSPVEPIGGTAGRS